MAEEGRGSASTVTPVVLGDKGDAMMGAGIVCRLKYGGVRCWSCKELEWEGVDGIYEGRWLSAES